MCVLTVRTPRLLIAEKDIVVYKKVIICNKRGWFKSLLFGKSPFYKSLYAGFIYKPNKVYTTILDEPKETYTGMVSGRGFYSWPEPECGSNVKCVIPKGSKYYIYTDYTNGMNIICSNKIKIVSELW